MICQGFAKNRLVVLVNYKPERLQSKAEGIAPSWYDETSTSSSESSPPLSEELPSKIGTSKSIRPPPPVPESGSPDELQAEEERLNFLLEHRKRRDLLNPAALDILIEAQKRRVEELQKLPFSHS